MRELEELRKLNPELSNLELAAFAPVLDAISKKDNRYRMSFVTFIAKKEPLQLFEEWQDEEFSRQIQAYRDFAQVKLERGIRRGRGRSTDRGRRVRGQFVLFKNRRRDTWTAFTSDGADFFDFGLMGYLKSFRPDMSRIFLSSDEMRGIFESLEGEIGWDILVSRAVLYSHESWGTITFDRGPYTDVFNRAEDSGKFVDKVEFKARVARQTILHAFLSREATCYFRRGQSSYIFNKLLPRLSEIGREKDQLFSDRERPIGESLLRPIEIVYKHDVFRGLADNIRLIDALSSLNRSSIAVYHKNPYLHLSLVDFVDGSSFDIYAGEADKLVIVPNYICTVHSLMRVYEQINRGFAEGALRDSQEPAYALEDFLEV